MFDVVPNIEIPSEDLFFDLLPKYLDLAPNIIFPWLNSLSSVGLDNKHHAHCIDSNITYSRYITPYGYNTILTEGMYILHAVHNTFLVIFDSGVNKVISGLKADFLGVITPPPKEFRLGGMVNGMLIEGIGTVG